MSSSSPFRRPGDRQPGPVGRNPEVDRHHGTTGFEQQRMAGGRQVDVRRAERGSRAPVASGEGGGGSEHVHVGERVLDRFETRRLLAHETRQLGADAATP